MRVRRLHGNDDQTIDLHPRITVVGRADDAVRSWVIESLRALVGPSEPPASGEVEVQGMLFDLDADSRSLLRLDALEHPGLVVGAADLPGHDAELVAARSARDAAAIRRGDAATELERCRRELAAAVTARDEVRAELQAIRRGEGAARELVAAAGAERSRLEFELEVTRAERSRRERDVTEAVLRRDEGRGRHRRARSATEAARGQRVKAEAELDAARTALAELREQEPPPEDADDRLDQARQHLLAIERSARELDPDAEASPLARQILALHLRWRDLTQRSEALGDPDVGADVADALASVVGAPATGRPIAEALVLADTWRDLHQQIHALDAGLAEAEQEADDRVARARRRLQEAETLANRPTLSPEQVARVEAAHQAVLDAQDRSSVLIGRSRRGRRLEQARLHEHEVLERLGFSGYAEFMMSITADRSSSAVDASVEEARIELNAARAALETVPGANDRARRRAELLKRRDEVAPRIAELLGYDPTGPESEEELRNLREGEPTGEAELARLAESLRAAGVVVDDDEPLVRDDLVLLARSFLDEDQAVADERGELDEATEALDRAVADLQVQRGLGRTDRFHLLRLPERARVEITSDSAAARRWDEVERARTLVHAAEDAVERGRRREARERELEDTVASATTRAAEATRAEATAALDLAPEHVDRITSAEDLVGLAELELADSRRAEVEVIARIDERARDRAVHDLAGTVADRLLDAEDVLSAAAEAEQAAASDLARLEGERDRTNRVVDELEAAAEETDRVALRDEVDWTLLSRLADLRSVGLAGALPLVLDDPFGVLDDEEVVMALDRLARMAPANQIVLVSNRPAILAWARTQTDDRAVLR